MYHPGEAYERTGRMNALYSWERDSLEGPHNAEAIERSAGEELYAEGLDVRTKEEGSVKSNAEELREWG